MRNHGKRVRSILGLEGKYSFARTVYVPADKDSEALLKSIYKRSMVVPLDMSLGIDGLPFKVTVDMMLDIAKRSLNAHSYEEVSTAYKSDFHSEVSDDLARRVTNFIGKLIYLEDCFEKDKALAHFKSLDTCKRAKRKLKGSVLYIEMDGGMLNTREKVNNSSWKENKLGLVFSADNLITYKKKETGEKVVWKIGQREYISYFGDSDTFLEFLYSVALRNGLEEHGTIVIISDGASWIKKFKSIYCSDLNVVHILDYTHFKENLFKSAAAYVPGTKEEKTAWAMKVKELVKAGKKDEALKMAEPYKDSRVDGIVNIYSYMKSNYDCIDYPKYKEKGYFIGSGAIESAHKSTSGERMDLPGMRWCVESGQYVLSAKMKLDSDLWYSYVVPLVYRRLADPVFYDA